MATESSKKKKSSEKVKKTTVEKKKTKSKTFKTDRELKSEVKSHKVKKQTEDDLSGEEVPVVERKDEVPVVDEETVKRWHRGSLVLVGLPHGFEETEIKRWFSQFSLVTRVSVIRSAKTGGSRGVGFVEFEDRDAAKAIAREMPHYIFGDVTLKIRYEGELEDRKKAAHTFRINNRNDNKKNVAQTVNQNIMNMMAKKKTENPMDKIHDILRQSGLDISHLPRIPLTTLP